MRQIFEEGLNKKKKVSALEAMLRMRKEEIGNKLRFGSNEWLTEQQVKSLFSRFSAKIKKGEPLTSRRIEEVTEAEEEEQANLDSARAMASITSDIIDSIEDDIPDTDHPLMVGEISLCDLTKSLRIDISNFGKVKNNEIQKIIEAIGANDLKEMSFKGRGKNPNLVILSERIHKYVKENCCCLI